jgi:hypothetical protein
MTSGDTSPAARTPIGESVTAITERGTFEVRETPSIINPELRVLVAGDLVKK